MGPGILDDFDNFFQNLRNNKMAMFILIVFLSLYASLWTKDLQPYTMNIFSNKYVKFIFFMLISYIASTNPALGVILAIALLVTLQTITYTHIEKQTEKFTPNGLHDFSHEYLNNPLLKENELPINNKLNLTLETPNDYYNNMIKKGKLLLNDSLEINNELKKRYDIREKDIMETTQKEGKILVQSGINRLQPSNNGEWISNQKLHNLANNNDNYKISYIKFDKFIENYSNNELIMNLFNLLKSKYNEITHEQILSEADFNDKMQDIYDTEFDLLIAIADVKLPKMNKNEQNVIQKKINLIKELKINGAHNCDTEINSLVNLLMN